MTHREGRKKTFVKFKHQHCVSSKKTKVREGEKNTGQQKKVNGVN